MIQAEQLNEKYVRHYSDQNLWIRQIETGNLYEEAVDRIPCRYTYEETDQPIIHEEPKEPEAEEPIEAEVIENPEEKEEEN